MQPTPDALYRVHQVQASRRGVSPLAYDDFCARMKDRSDTDLGGLLLPANAVKPVARPLRTPRFQLGRWYITPAAASALPQDDVVAALARHAVGDWGTVEGEDREANERALANGGRLVSAYVAGNGLKFWIITEAGRDCTTVLLPEDY